MRGKALTAVCVKQVKQDVQEEWDENMPLPGDIIEGVAEYVDDDDSFMSAKARSELSSLLGKISREADFIWLKVRRGDSTVKLRVCVVADRCSKLQRKFTVRAASDERHVAVLADLTFEQCFELQEMSRKVVNLDFKGFHQKAMKYDWKKKVGTYLPDNLCTVVSSILFMPLVNEGGIESPTIRAMAWFSAAVSSGIPLVFVNIQSEQIITSTRNHVTGKELTWGRQQNSNTPVNTVHGIRLWFLPGVAEVSLELIPQSGETRYGMDIRRTEEGFICIYSVSKGTAADRAGLGQLLEQANGTGNLVVMSRLQGKSLMPSTVDSEGLIHCCDNADIKETLISAMDRMDSIQFYIMSCSNHINTGTPPPTGAAILRPPN
ncbi:hypothetical protein Fot_14288 [Forsythia ovata]|uniref:Uncharacterized protein n=1 Tax=Forsythia ovata TaxID=205694 RepID=A0ABD1W5W7_9LAMI